MVMSFILIFCFARFFLLVQTFGFVGGILWGDGFEDV